MIPERGAADVCLLLEGTYPYVFGGVSKWVHELIEAQSDLTFHLVSLMPPNHEEPVRFEIPDNVVGRLDLSLAALPAGDDSPAGDLLNRVEPAVLALQERGSVEHLQSLMAVLSETDGELGSRQLLDSREAWAMLLSMYQRRHHDSSFIDFFWSFRAMMSGLYSVLLPELPRARVYHTISTGYAGLLAARSAAETGRPVLLTEHGIYTNERRIELAMSDWLYERPVDSLAVAGSRRHLKDFWIETFTNYSRLCYESASRIITLYEANQQFQIHDGADPDKLLVIPNGIDVAAYGAIERVESKRPTIALIGRVVPIKDVKTYLRACAILRESVPDVLAYVLGPTEEDPEYFEECGQMVRHLGLADHVEFTGRVKLSDYLGSVDAIALTSISEAQPLVILEAGAAGIPTVATDVGACREMILGRDGDSDPLGPGGAITPLASPAETAQALARLLTDEAWRKRCGEAIRARVRRDYDKKDLDVAYRGLYERYRDEPTRGQGEASATRRMALEETA